METASVCKVCVCVCVRERGEGGEGGKEGGRREEGDIMGMGMSLLFR